MQDKRTADDGEYMRRMLATVGVTALVAVLVLLAWLAARPLIAIFAGVLVAVLLRALTDFTRRHTRLPDSLALALVIVLVLGVAAGAAWFLAHEAAEQFEELGASLTTIWDGLRNYLKDYAWGRSLLDLFSSDKLPASGADILGRIFGAIMGGLSTLVVSIFVGLYLAADPGLYRRGFVHLMPRRCRRRAAEILDRMEHALRAWLLGTLFNMVVIGTVTTAGLWLLGIPLSLALGIIAFFLEFIPYLGPIIAAVPAILVATTVSPMDAVYTALLYIAIQNGEGYLLAPLVYQRSVSLPPALTVGAQLIMGTFLGVLGLMFATPLTACTMVLVQCAYVDDTPGERIEDEDSGGPRPSARARAH